MKPTDLATSQLSDVRILLLRHQARAGGKRIAEFDKPEFSRAPNNQIFAEARQMQSTYGETKKEFAHEIAIADRVDTVLAYARKAERACQKFLIERNGRSCERTGTERENVGPIQTIAQPFCVALKCFDLPKQVMRKSDGLCALQVCVAGHHHLEMFFGEIEQRSLQTPQARRDFRDLSFDVKPQVERDLVVPAPRGVQFRASGTDSFRQRGFDVH